MFAVVLIIIMALLASGRIGMAVIAGNYPEIAELPAFTEACQWLNYGLILFAAAIVLYLIIRLWKAGRK